MWDNIKYIFQIPLAWFKKIHDRVFNAYGVNFLIVKEGYYGGAEIGIDEGAFGDAVNQAVNLSGVVKSVNDVGPDENGNVTLDIPELPDQIVTTVNGQTGNVVLGAIVNSVNGIAPVNGNVQLPEESGITIEDVADYLDANSYQTQTDVTSYVQNEIQDFVTDADVTSYVTQELQDYAHTVDGVRAVDGVVNFNLSPDKWMKTDGNGHITTTNDTPITASPSSSGYIYNNNGTVEYKDDEYVTLDTTQTITATKTFVGTDVNVNIAGGQLNVTGSQQASALRDGALILERPIGAFLDIGPTTNYTHLINYGDAYGFGITDPYKIKLDTPANQATLTNHPTDTSTSSKAIATVGYCQEKFLAAPPTEYTPTTSNITVVTGISWNGTQIVTTRTQLRFYNGIFVGSTNQGNTTINTVAYAP